MTRTGNSGSWRSTPRCPTLSRAARRTAPALWYKATTSTTGTYSSNLTNPVHRPRVFSFPLQAFPFPSLTHLPFPCLSSLILSPTCHRYSSHTFIFTFHNSQPSSLPVPSCSPSTTPICSTPHTFTSKNPNLLLSSPFSFPHSNMYPPNLLLFSHIHLLKPSTFFFPNTLTYA